MGGFVGAARDLAKPLIDTLTSPEVKQQAIEIGSKAFRSLEGSMGQTEVGKDTIQYMKKYFENYDKTFTRINQAEPHLNSVEMSNKAKNVASEITFGKNHSHLAALMAASERQHGAFHTKVLMDHVAMVLDDSVNRSMVDGDLRYNKNLKPRQQLVSKSKYDISRNAEYKLTLDSLGRDAGNTDITPVKSHYGDALARPLRNWAVNNLAPWIVIPHLGTSLNLALDYPLKSLAKAVADIMPGNYAETKEMLLKSGIYHECIMRAKQENEAWVNGKIEPKNMSQFGRILTKVLHAPGFAPAREWQITAAGATAYRTAIDQADNYFRTQSKKASIDLQNLGISPSKVMQLKGKLTEEDLMSAVYKGTDNDVFLHRELSRSYYGQKNNFFRLQTMFHSYVSSEGKFIARVLHDTYKAGDLAKYAQTIVVLGVAFPNVGELIKKAEMYARGQWQEANEDRGFHKLYGLDAKGFVPKVEQAAEEHSIAYGHMAAVGMLTSFLNATLTGNVLKLAAGPIFGTIGTDVVDAGKVVKSLYQNKGFSKNKKGFSNVNHDHGLRANSKALARDALAQSLPLNIGKTINHQLIPTQKEEKERHHKVSLKFPKQ